MIHEFIKNAWEPGAAKCEGNKPLPPNPAAGVFFNDVTGKSAQHREEVTEDLADHVMKMGTLYDILPAQVSAEWSALARQFENLLTHEIKAIEAMFLTVALDPDANGYKLLETKSYDPFTIYDITKMDIDLAQRTADFVFRYMGATGQLDYFRAQPWFVNKSCSVEVSIAFTVGRPTKKLGWHKDTDGKNLFVGLIFGNDSPISSTEWTPDLLPVGTHKEEILKKVWPDNLIREIGEAKLKITSEYQKQNKKPIIDVQALGKNGFESWVDELVWHSSPYFAKRGRLTLQEAHEAIQIFIDQANLSEAGYEVFVCLALEPKTTFSQFIQKQGSHTNNMDLNTALAMTGDFMDSFFSDDRAVQALKADIEKVTWETISKDTVVSESISTAETKNLKPSGIEGRSRAMSDPNVQAQQKELAGNASDRNFMRIWVQVERITDND